MNTDQTPLKKDKDKVRDSVSDKEVILLCMLMDRPKYAYEIEKEITNTSMRDWTEIAFSSIYFILKKLETRHFIEVKIEFNEKKQTRKRYSITEEGKTAAKNNLCKFLSHQESIVWHIDVALAYLLHLDFIDVINCLQQYENEIDTKITGYQKLHEYLVAQKCDWNRLELANRPLYLLKAEKDWIHDFRNRFQAKL